MAPQRAPADDVPTVEALRAKVAAATGTVPPSRYEHIHYVRAGIAGDDEIVRSGDDFRETEGYGPLQSAHGAFGGQAWHENYNGQVVLDQPDPGNATKEKFTTTVTRVSVPFDAFVIARLNSVGSGNKEYVDPVTSRVVRREAITPTQTTVTTYDDFRTVDGYTTAWHWSIQDGHPENDADCSITQLVARPVQPAEVGIPAPRRALVEFPPGKTSVDVPAKFVNDSFIVRAVINGRGLDFLLDTGASGITIDDDVARQLGLHEFAQFSNAANAGRIGESFAIVPAMNIGELRMNDVAVRTLPGLPGDDYGDTKVVGLLGFDFIAELLLHLDYERGRLTAFQAGSTPLPTHGKLVTLDIRLGTQQPMTTALVNGAAGERFVVDTGNRGGFIIFDYFARRNPGALVDLGGGSDRERYSNFSGVGGRVDITPYRLATVQIGKAVFNNFFGYRVAQRKAYAINQDGLIGTTFLRDFNLWLDYVDSAIVMELNGNGASALR